LIRNNATHIEDNFLHGIVNDQLGEFNYVKNIS
jgi:hypothetical protein